MTLIRAGGRGSGPGRQGVAAPGLTLLPSGQIAPQMVD
jgi:hypothetical protein